MTLLDAPERAEAAPEAPDPSGPALDGASRRRRRRRLVAWSVLPALVALAVAGALGGRAITTDRGIAAIDGSALVPSRAADAVEWFDRSEAVTFSDREVPSFNRGVAWIAAGELSRARAEFDRALERAEGAARCRVVVNLALTVEAQGDALVDADPHGSQALYAEAKGVAEGNPECRARRTPASDGPGDRLDRLLERLEAKLETEGSREVSRPRADPNSAREPEDDFSELEKQLDENAETRSEGRELEEGVELAPTVSNARPW
jgi:hypothetical protein